MFCTPRLIKLLCVKQRRNSTPRRSSDKPGASRDALEIRVIGSENAGAARRMPGLFLTFTGPGTKWTTTTTSDDALG